MRAIISIISTTPSIVKNASISYFKPWTSIKLLSDRATKDIKANEHKSQIKNENKTILLISELVCFNQTMFIQYNYLAAQKHMAMKECFYSRASDKRTKTESLYIKLINYLNQSFMESASENFKFLHKYFSHRSNDLPRICIKGNFGTEDKNIIITVFRDRMVNYGSDCDITKSTSLYDVLQKGTYYINNDIPASFFDGTYKNPRLDDSLLDKFKNKIDGIDIVKREWEKFWIKTNSDILKPEDCYKSTLVVPMTIRYNLLNEEFKKSIPIKNFDRIILGFLCFDHKDTNYFNEKDDIAISYICADLISLYLVTRLTYTKMSKTFKKISNSHDKSSIESKLDKLNQFKYEDLVDLNLEYFDIQESSNNKLYNIDSLLLKYIKHVTPGKHYLNKHKTLRRRILKNYNRPHCFRFV